MNFASASDAGNAIEIPREWSWMESGTSQVDLQTLFAVNILLQVFDGLVTHQALQLGCIEANPLVAASFTTYGLLPALLLFKAQACGLLLLLRRSAPPPLALRALRMLAIAYCLCSVLPWLGTLIPLAVRTSA